jgi:hypothetical protein
VADSHAPTHTARTLRRALRCVTWSGRARGWLPPYWRTRRGTCCDAHMQYARRKSIDLRNTPHNVAMKHGGVGCSALAVADGHAPTHTTPPCTHLGDGSAVCDVEREGEGLAASLLADTEGDALRCAKRQGGRNVRVLDNATFHHSRHDPMQHRTCKCTTGSAGAVDAQATRGAQP